MKSPHLLRIGTNVRKVKENLISVLDAAGIAAIQAEISTNVTQLYRLGQSHYRFATRQNNRAWRQKISRLYYAAYNVSRAVRLCKFGDYASDVGDHKKIEVLPDDFPNSSRYANRLGVLRDDRNLCDYDHTARISDLVVNVPDAIDLVQDFLGDARAYLLREGVTL
jgi:hypothetical protein